MSSLISFSESLIQFALSNLVIALPLGLIAWGLQRVGTRPFLTHLLWLFVLVKLVTPPIWSLPIAALPDDPPAIDTVTFLPVAGNQIASVPDASWLSSLDPGVAIVSVWLLGSLLVLAACVGRVLRCNRLLARTSTPAGSGLKQVAAQIAASLGLKRAPAVFMTAARISPMVWSLGPRARVYLPRGMAERMDPHELVSILTHEIGHISRGDHLVRWLETLVCVTLWWNPLAWWARRNLRVCEEICCDAFVLSRTDTCRDGYAGALVSAMELLAVPTIRPSGMASYVNGGFIERRIRMILSGKSILQTPLWVRGILIAGAALVLPLGFSVAQDAGDDLTSVRQWLESGVNSAFLTQEQADLMIRALELSQNHQLRLVQPDGTEINVQRRIVAVPDNGNMRIVAEDIVGNVGTGILELQNAQIVLEKALVFAHDQLEQAVASGQLTEAEADAISQDLRNARASGVDAGEPAIYYEQQFEQGLIDRATLERRKRTIAEIEQAWNQSPQAAELRSLTESRQVVQAAPVTEIKTDRINLMPGPVQVTLVQTAPD